MARARPEVDVLAFEVFEPAAAALVARLVREDVTNVRVAPVDAVAGLERLVPAGALTEVWTFFPDPWPKPKHHKRRLVDAAFADLVASRLAPGRALAAGDGLGRVRRPDARRRSTRTPPSSPSAEERGDRPVTRFERRGLAEDRAIADLVYRRAGLTCRAGGWTSRTTGPGSRAGPPSPGSGPSPASSSAGRPPCCASTRRPRWSAPAAPTPACTPAARSPTSTCPTTSARRPRSSTAGWPGCCPPDLVVSSVRAAPPGFDARFAAVWRRYVYRLADDRDAARPAAARLRAGRARRRSTSTGSPRSAPDLLGLHDFAAFCRRREGATTIRTLLDLGAERVAAGPLAGVVEVTVRADAFCHSMVRSLVGALVAVADGRRDRGLAGRRCSTRPRGTRRCRCCRPAA